MAVDQDLLDDIAATVANLYAELESALNKQIADRLGEDLDSPYQLTKLDAVGKLRRSAQLLIATLDATRSKVVRDAIARAYRDGYASALTDIPEQHFPNSGIGRRARQATGTIPNAPVIENIAQSLHRDLGDVSGNILRNVLDAYRSVQAAAAARIVAGVDTRRQAAQALWQRLVDRGVTSFTDTAGRRWKLSSYAEMATRTNAARAAVQGQTDRLGTVGVHLVVVSDHGQECKLCRPFEGKILSLNGVTGRIQVEHATRDGHMVTVNVLDTLDGARRKGFQHPNCRHSVSAYTPGITEQPKNTADPEGDTARQRQREIERNIRKHKERATTALTPEAKKLAEAKTREWQKAMRDHLAANPKLKRLRYREQPGAGNTPGAGGPKGGPVGDLEPPRQPTLDGGPGASRTAPRTDEQTSPAARSNAGQQDVLEVKPEPKKAKPKAVAPKAKPRKTPSKAPSKPEPKPRDKRAPGMKDGVRHRTNQDGLEWARKKLPIPDLTKNERESLKHYTDDDYELVNNGLRGKPIHNRTRYDKRLRDLDSAFEKAKTPEPVILHRGVGRLFADFLGVDITRPETMKSLIGKVFTEDGFMSTSVGKEAAFIREIQLMIRVPDGFPTLNIMPISSFHEGEREILLRRNARYVVHSVYKRGNIWHMEIEIVPDDWAPPDDWKPDPYGDADVGYS